jgi:hypothetical protein
MGEMKIVVAGCVAQQEGEALLRRVPEVDLVMGPQWANKLDELLERVDAGGSQVGARRGERAGKRRQGLRAGGERARSACGARPPLAPRLLAAPTTMPARRAHPRPHPPGVRHGADPHRGGHHDAAPRLAADGVGQRDLRLQRKVHLLRRADDARPGAEPAARGREARDGGARRGRCARARAAGGGGRGAEGQPGGAAPRRGPQPNAVHPAPPDPRPTPNPPTPAPSPPPTTQATRRSRCWVRTSMLTVATCRACRPTAAGGARTRSPTCCARCTTCRASSASASRRRTPATSRVRRC